MTVSRSSQLWGALRPTAKTGERGALVSTIQEGSGVVGAHSAPINNDTAARSVLTTNSLACLHARQTRERKTGVTGLPVSHAAALAFSSSAWRATISCMASCATCSLEAGHQRAPPGRGRHGGAACEDPRGHPRGPAEGHSATRSHRKQSKAIGRHRKASEGIGRHRKTSEDIGGHRKTSHLHDRVLERGLRHLDDERLDVLAVLGGAWERQANLEDLRGTQWRSMVVNGMQCHPMPFRGTHLPLVGAEDLAGALQREADPDRSKERRLQRVSEGHQRSSGAARGSSEIIRVSPDGHQR